MRHWPWDVLGIDATSDEGAVRKAYADALRKLDLDRDVDAYADLRNARDEGLWLARNGGGEDEDDFGLGSLDDPMDIDGDAGFDLTSVRFSETSPVDGPQVGGLDWSDVGTGAAGNGGFEDIPHQDSPQPELSEEQERARAAWSALIDILYPGDDYSEEAITFEQMHEGNDHLKVLIERADECDIEEHHALDHGLAQMMAETWPRSAPFVEQAAEAFHWLDESGHIEERPALMFLNLRLRGMRFNEKVQEEDHPLNKAWVELSRPGRASLIDKWRVRYKDVNQLLRGIRERYPEVESYLDPQRVHSWEHGSGGWGLGNVPWIAIVFIGLIALRAIGSVSGGDDDLPPPMPMTAQYDEGAGFERRINDLFGDDIALDQVRAIDPVFADQLSNQMGRERYGFSTIEGFVRGQAVRSRNVAGFDELVALGELKRVWMTAAMREPAGVCQNVMVGDFNSIPLLLTQEEAETERRYLKQLLDAGVLSHLGGREGEEYRFDVPGWAVERTIRDSGLSDAQVVAALRDPDHELRCRVEFALLGAVLEQPGRVSEDLLRGL